MSLFSIIKENSKRALQGNWGKAIAVSFIPTLVQLLLSILGSFAFLIVSATGISDPRNATQALTLFGTLRITLPSVAHLLIIVGTVALSLLMVIFLLLPLQLGVVYWYYNLIQGKVLPVSDIFHFFENFKLHRRSVWHAINVGFRQGVWSLLFMAVPGILTGLFFFLIFNPTTNRGNSMFAVISMCFFLSFLLTIGVALLSAVYLNKYSLSQYFICGDPTIKVNAAIKKSIHYTKGYRFNILWFRLSFIGWILLTSFLFPFAFYVIPYLSASTAMYSHYIIETKNRTEPKIAEEPPKEKEIPRSEIKTSAVEVTPQNVEVEEEIPVTSPTEPTVHLEKETPSVDSVWGADVTFQAGFSAPESPEEPRLEAPEPEPKSEPTNSTDTFPGL